MSDKQQSHASAYDRYVNYKLFGVAAVLFASMLVIPVPASMRDVAVEYSAGKDRVIEHFSSLLFGKPSGQVAQWQALTARILESNVKQGILTRGPVLEIDEKALKKQGIATTGEHLEQFKRYVRGMDEGAYLAMMTEARALRIDRLTYAGLSEKEKESADQAAWRIKVCAGLVLLVVFCFLTEAVPLPSVAFLIGIILVFTRLVGREEVASLFWSDACWFIMGSLMFAAAFVKTGVDKRFALLLFRYLAKPSVLAITSIIVMVIAPLSAFISDHALAAMFLPVAVALYTNSLNERIPIDPELAKMLIIGVAMAANIGGFGSPSGGARNVIIMTYLENMFGISMSYGQWMLYAFPFVIVMIPVLILCLNLMFRPKIKNLGASLEVLKKDIDRMGRWNAKQVVAVVIFFAMLFLWVTESNLVKSLLGMRLGVGVVAVAGAVAYLLAGIVNWRDYQEKVDWGVVWLYAGAIIFGKMLDETGTAYWMARSVVDGLAAIGLATGPMLLVVGGLVTAGITNLMADGPAAAAVGPLTLSIAAIAKPGTTMVPFMGLVTSCAASMAYLLVIGTPPNAIVYGSGYLKAKDYLRVGIPCLVAAFAVMMLMALVYWPLLGTFAGLEPM